MSRRHVRVADIRRRMDSRESAIIALVKTAAAVYVEDGTRQIRRFR
jgi:cyanophycinase-like exopeptidase